MKLFRVAFLSICFLALLGAGVEAEDAPPGMVRVKGGCFMMGTDKVFYYEVGRKNDRERPVHKVCVDDFYLDPVEVSQKNYEKVMNRNPSILIGEDFPADHVTFDDALEYCSRLGRRLPTEAEWEYAARAGSRGLYPWGDKIDGDYLWYDANSVRAPHPVGTKKPNAWGVHDMMGSVWEWTSDWFSESYYKESPVQNPRGPDKRVSYRIIRGGSWVDDESRIRASIRFPGLADATEHFLVGVRCAYSAKAGKK